MLPQEIIALKRESKKLTKGHIDTFISMINDQSVSDSQIAAFCMAVFLNDIDVEETVDLTKAMAESGRILDWSDMNLNGPVLDKHSSGGVGDKTSLILAPIIAACGGYVGKISGRGLGHTGGTIDKLESILGVTFDTSLDDFKKSVKKIGCCITSQKPDLVPADKKIYGIRDITATVEHIGLITASIVSKKIAMNPHSFTADIKVGSGAMMETIDDARVLAKSIVSIANGAGLKTQAIITGMNQVLSHSAGNALEIREVINYLKNENRTKRLDDLIYALGSHMLMSGSLYSSLDNAEQAIENAITSGQALERFSKMISELGGPSDLVDKVNQYLPAATFVKDVIIDNTGIITRIDVQEIGMAIVDLGGGRKHPDDIINPSVGIEHMLGIGEKVITGQTRLCILHAKNESDWQKAAQAIMNAVTVDNTTQGFEDRNIIKEIITA